MVYKVLVTIQRAFEVLFGAELESKFSSMFSAVAVKGFYICLVHAVCHPSHSQWVAPLLPTLMVEMTGCQWLLDREIS